MLECLDTCFFFFFFGYFMEYLVWSYIQEILSPNLFRIELVRMTGPEVYVEPWALFENT